MDRSAKLVRAVFGIALSILAFLALCGLFLFKSHASPISNPQPPISNPQSPIPNPQSSPWWTAVQEELTHREYYVTWQESPPISGEPLPSSRHPAGVYQAPNRAQNLRSSFYPTGVWIVERTAPTPPWTFGLALVGFGRGEAAVTLPPATLSVQQNRVTYRRSLLTESYLNDESGLEQIIEIPNTQYPIPNTDPSPQILLELALTGDLVPHLDGEAIQLTDGQGIPILQYGPLQATDPAGHPIPLRLQLNTTNHASRITHPESRATHNHRRPPHLLPYHPPFTTHLVPTLACKRH